MMRKTDQREAIRRTFVLSDRPLSPQEVLGAAQEEVPGLGIATVYRHLKALAEEVELKPVDLPGEPTRYESAGKEHHHHFHCDGCGKVFDLHGCAGGISKLLPGGFQMHHHEVLIYGKCPACAA